MNERTGDGSMTGYMTGIAPVDLLAALARSAEEVEAAVLVALAADDPDRGASDAAAADMPTTDAEWTPAEILGHVCDGARVWGGRMRRVVREEAPELEPFDEALALRVAGYHWKRLEPLLAEFRIVSEDTLAFLRGLAPDDWTRVGLHPSLGRVALGDLVRIEMEHERDHARQLRAASGGDRNELRTDAFNDPRSDAACG